MAQLKLENIRKTFNETPVIHGIDLTVEHGEFCVFVGPSGCGKSTLLRLIAGLEECDDGEITLDDQDITDSMPSKRGMAMVFQSYALYPHMTVEENMGFGLKIAKVNQAEIKTKVAKAAKTLQIEHLLKRRPKELSGGQRQRVAIGRAIVRDPKMFLFDEPLSNLDAALRVEMRYELARIKSQLNTTVVYVTHDQVEAMTLADKIVVLKDGRIEQVGQPLELYERPANLFVAGFIGSPKMNLVAVDLQRTESASAQLRWPGGGVWPLPASGVWPAEQKLTVGARPEHLQITSPKDGLPTAKVTLIERLGSETYVHVRTVGDNEQAIVVKVEGNAPLSMGQIVALQADASLLHLFAADGKRLN
ncbi:MAG: sn-glycerol-3-phosphate ABC transporter ATP-binding protein UgpC [Burkholderiales bacterium]|nr:MAG: sn-glycerol-3-phosphate ABC transporter ATP-binding protein UgpC [Burkholderiales bacterium]